MGKKMETCEKCNGKGSVLEELNPRLRGATRRRPCSSCKGSGQKLVRNWWNGKTKSPKR